MSNLICSRLNWDASSFSMGSEHISLNDDVELDTKLSLIILIFSGSKSCGLGDILVHRDDFLAPVAGGLCWKSLRGITMLDVCKPGMLLICLNGSIGGCTFAMKFGI